MKILKEAERLAALDDEARRPRNVRVVRVLDASAVLAWLREEPGARIVEECLQSSLISAVNLSEVLQKSISLEAGVSGASLVEDLAGLGLSFVGFGAEDAGLAASMWPVVSPLGLGIADRACLATAVRLGIPALTADRPWKEVEWEGLVVETIR